MADTVFTAPNIAPDLQMQDQNYTAKIFAAPKAAGLTETSTSGWRDVGPIEPGSYSSPMTVSTNETMLGSNKVAVSQHVNQMSMNIQFNMAQITPFGQQLKNRTVQTPVVTYGTGDTTVAAGGGGVKTITLTAATNFAVNDIVEVIIGTGASQYKDYRRIQSIVTNAITLDYPLYEAPADASTVKSVQQIKYRQGLSQLAKWSLMAVFSGDEYKDQLIHVYSDVRIPEANNTMPDANVGNTTYNMTVFPSRETVDGKIQPVFGSEILKFAPVPS